MSIVRTIGGDRLDAGNKKMQVAMHNYERSTHDLSRVWRSSMAPGTLVPCMCEVGLNGDTFDIDLDAMVRTIPTAAPLFGSFKLQIDVFKADMRLYNAVLHNNQFGIGLKMEQVIFPKVNFKTFWGNADYKAIGTPFECSQVAPDSLAHYLGVSGLARIESSDIKQQTIERNFNAVPFLAYYDIFKNYYMNKQENNAYVIAPNVSNDSSTIQNFITEIQTWAGMDSGVDNKMPNGSQSWYKGDAPISFKIGENGIILIGFTQYVDATKINFIDNEGNPMNVTKIDEWEDNSVYYYRFQTSGAEWINNNLVLPTHVQSSGYYSPNGIKIEQCDANVFDAMREKLLNPTNTGLGKEYVLNFDVIDETTAPYCYIGAQEPHTKRSVASFSQCGLMLKTYLSDIMNCWVSDDTINMVNGIASVNTEAGNFTIDALNLAQKVYNMLNRIAVSGGSYYDWQEVIWGEEVRGSVETPIYCGGMSSEIVFEEVVSTADTQTAAAGAQPLGSLAGKGTLAKKNNGHVIIKCDEPCIIMAIASITPRIDYSTGNKWYNTELNTLNDLHKPALDGIGWQDLLAERGYWWGTAKAYNQITGEETNTSRYVIGKQPAWLNYMTAINEVHGDFANRLKAGYMVLARNYDTPEEETNSALMDNYTSYINPTKFNYAFADTNLYAQNFWVQIALNIQARRKISAKQIPNL
ncbi:major capsid protein [Microvirus sp.]|nr:major capsid protein [Microvirus sp.]